MIYTYRECLKKYKNNYRIHKAIDNGELYKLSKGIFSDKRNASDTEIILKKYPKAVFTSNSAFYYQGLTDTIPSCYYLMTDKNASKIANKEIKQIFDNNNSMELGKESISFNGTSLPVFSKERLLVELIRNKCKLPYDYYKEIIGNYRKLINDIDFGLVENYAQKLPKTNLVMDTIKTEVF